MKTHEGKDMAKKEDSHGHDSGKAGYGEAAHAHDVGKPAHADVVHDSGKTAQTDANRAAVLAEREACAKVADEIARINPHAAAIAEAIRARGTT